MGIFKQLGLEDKTLPTIDWGMTPTDTFTIFESWGGKNGERLRNNDEKFYYFFIDSWNTPAELYLMERGVKHAEILARIKAPQKLIDSCIAEQGRSTAIDKSYAINKILEKWLKQNIFDNFDASRVVPVEKKAETKDDDETGLPGLHDPLPKITRASLRSEAAVIHENEVGEIIKANGFFDSQHNPDGFFSPLLVDNGDHNTVTDLATGIMWERRGCDIANIRRIKGYVEELNQQNFAGHNDWRLPTLVEAMSLMTPQKNHKGLHLHPCFSMKQPFIFLADERRPGGYWFVDYKQGTCFWASGTIPGGFGRACRTIIK